MGKRARLLQQSCHNSEGSNPRGQKTQLAKNRKMANKKWTISWTTYPFEELLRQSIYRSIVVRKCFCFNSLTTFFYSNIIIENQPPFELRPPTALAFFCKWKKRIRRVMEEYWWSAASLSGILASVMQKSGQKLVSGHTEVRIPLKPSITLRWSDACDEIKYCMTLDETAAGRLWAGGWI